MHAQAPQRERVSRAQSPIRGGPRRADGPAPRRRWTEQLAPDRNMGVPQLMLILEPNIVWERTRGYCEQLGKEVESLYCPGEFFQGWHKAGKLVSTLALGAVPAPA